jgi:hypothetical protein
MKNILCLLLPLPLLFLASCKTTDANAEDPYASAYPGYDPNGIEGGSPPPPAASDYTYGNQPYPPAPGQPTYPSGPAQPTYPSSPEVSTLPAYPTPPAYPSVPTPPPYPGAPSPSPYPATPDPYTPPPVSSGRSHTVQKGTRYMGLARQYGTSVGAIKSANGMTSDTIVIGKRMVIP